MIERRFLGIDPGISGAVAFYFPSKAGNISAESMPTAGGEVDAGTLAQRLVQLRPTLTVVEGVASIAGQGVASTFKFGTAYGTARGVILALGIPDLVAPSRWKAHFRLNANKEKSRALALRLWPSCRHFSRKKDHGRAKAALLARYGAEVQIERAP